MKEEKQKIVTAQCRNLLREYDLLLKDILAEEEARIPHEAGGDSEFEVIRNTFLNKGIREGLKRFIAAINRNSSIQ